MALTPEMQAQVDMQNATENNRAANQAAAQAKQVKLEMIRAAKEILVENRRTKAAADATDITASAVTALATDLTAFVNS
jgi:phage baseplate assembly protein gpV